MAPEDFWKFSLALFKKQQEYFDIPTSTLTPIQIREKLAALVSESVSGDKAALFSDLLVLKSTPNGGTAVTDDLKYTSEFRLGYRARSGLISSLLCSQVLQAEWHPRLADRALGRSHRKRDLELLGRERVDRVFGEEGYGLRD